MNENTIIIKIGLRIFCCGELHKKFQNKIKNIITNYNKF